MQAAPPARLGLGTYRSGAARGRNRGGGAGSREIYRGERRPNPPPRGGPSRSRLKAGAVGLEAGAAGAGGVAAVPAEESLPSPPDGRTSPPSPVFKRGSYHGGSPDLPLHTAHTTTQCRKAKK